MMQVGDSVYVVYADSRRPPLYAVVRSIGRKYIHIDAHPSESKFDIATLKSVEDNTGWNCKATLYKSKEDYELSEKLLAEKVLLLDHIKLRLGITTDKSKLKAIYDILTDNKKKGRMSYYETI